MASGEKLTFTNDYIEQHWRLCPALTLGGRPLSTVCVCVTTEDRGGVGQDSS